MGRVLLFDWGNTIMTDYGLPGPMYLWEKVGWVPHAEKALKELSGLYPCYLVTNAGLSDREMVLKALQRVGADLCFSGIFTSTDLGFEKPDPEFFHSVCSHLKVLPSDCIMTGDHYIKDITGARQFGMKTVWLNFKMQTGDFPMADRIINTMADLSETIRSL
jgi:FMN phosphatase YigB (HAD superfamily)